MRLTYRDRTVPHTNAKGELWEAYSDANYNEVINKLAAYEDAEEQGRLVILPCYVYFKCTDGEVYMAEIETPDPTKPLSIPRLVPEEAKDN